MNSRYRVAIVILAFIILGFSEKSYSWSLFFLLNGSYDEKFDLPALTDKDILYLPSIQNKKLFESINDLSICRRSDVREYIFQYLTHKRDFLKRAFKKSKTYLEIIDEVFKDNNDIPPDIRFLPLLESGFNPYAVSKSNAVGLWQFLNRTSKMFGIKNNRWVDERRSIHKKKGHNKISSPILSGNKSQ